ncbi:hypothetical protein C2845_PM15G05990 [Panicum miliaceum]|uniref:Uncharacterized protein n=1 Tax=Panicum miliaceum TaxID=4540 RepID=A0A3L6QC19_PANMI|nr:hypothetical protein C2845_PM15G05990 [Panicum miliaceum]
MVKLTTKQQMLGTDGAEQMAKKNTRQRQAYHASKPEHHKLSKEQRRRNSAESKKAYKRMMKEFRANNLHPDSIAMQNPSFTPKLIFPSVEASTISVCDQIIIPKFSGTPVYMETASEETTVPKEVVRNDEVRADQKRT